MSDNPALFDHCTKIYTAMQMACIDTEKTEDGYFIYEGSLTALFEEVGLGQPYYTTVVNRLKAMGCIRQLQRGGGKMKSKWYLIGAPTKESYDASAGGKSSTRSDAQEQIAQATRDLTQRLSRMEALLASTTDKVSLLTNKVTEQAEQIRVLEVQINVKA